MAYGRWLYKEIDTNRGSISLSIYKKNYSGNAIEIDALVADSIVISIDGDGITAPIIGSSLSFSIVDTEQIDTSEFFTPDATMYRIDLSRDGTLEWSGYLTPDSYQENLAYRDTINLIARDNLGRLEEFQFLKSKGLQNMETFIGELLSEVGCPQYINWDVRKVSIAKGKGISEVTNYNDIWVNTELFVEKDYKEIVEMILTGLGCQMRYNGYNNLIITSLSDIPSFPTQSAIFINKSGFKEILPAWKDVTINQDYGLIENFFDGYLTKEQVGSGLTFDPGTQMPDKWMSRVWVSSTVTNSLVFANPYKWAEGIEDGADDSFFPPLRGLILRDSIAWKKKVRGSSAPMEVKMSINNTLRRLIDSSYQGTGNLFCGSDDTKDHILEYELTYHFLVSFVDSSGKEKYMSRYGWVDIDDDVDDFFDIIHSDIFFNTSPCMWDDAGTWDQEKEVSITINNLTEDGELRLHIANVFWGEKNEVPDNVFFGKIRDIRIAYKLDNGELASRLQVSDRHNINGRVELEIGQVPVGKGDYFAYAGGFFDSQGLPLTNFKRYYDDINNYILMELVAREHIHFNKDNYMALSGDMISDSPFSFRNNIIYKGERYALISASLAVISNTLSVTNMIQVTDYEVAELTTINSPLESSSGTKVGSGNREVLQFSNDAGNAKRLYDLDFAMDSDDIDNAYAIVDTDRWQEAKRVKVSELGGLFNKAFEVQLDESGNVIAVIAKANLGARGGISARYQGDWGDVPVTPTINSLADINDVTITNPTNGQGLVYRDGVWVNEAVQSGGISGDTNDYFIWRGWGNQDANDAIMGSYFTYANNAPFTGPLVNFSADGYNLELNGGYGAAGMIAYRTKNGDNGTWNSWRQLVDEGNIGNYTAGNANALGGISAEKYLYGFIGAYDANAQYDFTYRGIALGANLPSSSQYGSLLTLPYRKTQGNTYPDFAAQIFLPNGDDATPDMFFRTSLSNSWNPWRRVIAENSNGNVLIGDTVDNGDRLQVMGNLRVIRQGDRASYLNITVSDVQVQYNGWDTGDGYVYHDFFSNGNQIARIDGLNNKVIAYRCLYSPRLEISSNSISDSGGYLSISSISNEMCISGETNDALFVNYRPNHNGYAPKIWIWNAGSSSSWANMQMGSITANGNIYASGGLTARYASDIRLKEDIHTISTDVALQTIMALNPITFRWNAKATELCSWLNGESQGFVAQEYEALIPNSGSEMWGEYRGIDYNRAIPYIVAVEQNHETRIKQLEEELQTLKREYYGNR